MAHNLRLGKSFKGKFHATRRLLNSIYSVRYCEYQLFERGIDFAKNSYQQKTKPTNQFISNQAVTKTSTHGTKQHYPPVQAPKLLPFEQGLISSDEANRLNLPRQRNAQQKTSFIAYD